MRILLRLFVCLMFMGFSSVSQAEDPKVVMEEMVVTATRTEASLGKVGGSAVTVITAEDIQAKGQTSVEAVLKGVPGIDVAALGGPGTQTSVFIRGADSKNTLVLIDGMMYNDPSSSNRGADLGNLTADNIERVEIVRGPQSVLYGSNATAGVINIITKTGQGKPKIYAGAEAGSYNTWKTYGGASGALDKFNFSFSASRTETDGFSAADADNNQIPQAGNTDEEDAWKNTTLSAKLGFDISRNFKIRTVMRYLDSESDVDDSNFAGYANDSNAGPNAPTLARIEKDERYGKVEVLNFFMDRFIETQIYAQRTDQTRDAFKNNDGSFDYSFDSGTTEYGFQGSLNFENDIVTVGTTFFKESYESDTSAEKTAETKSYWAQNQLFLGDAFDIVAGFRVDDHEKFGTETTYRIAPAYTIVQTGTTIKGTYGTGFRAPSLYELFSDPNAAWFYLGGNQNLEPETSKGWDVGVEQQLLDNRVKIGMTYFETRFENRIAYVTNPLTWMGTYEQQDGISKTTGLESFVNWKAAENLDLQLNHTYSHARDHNDARMTRRPLNRINVNVKYRPLEKLALNVDARWVDDRDTITSAKDANGNRVYTLDDYTLVNLSATYDICSAFQIYGRIDNLFDEFYEEAWSYGTPGLSGYAGFRVSY